MTNEQKTREEMLNEALAKIERAFKTPATHSIIEPRREVPVYMKFRRCPAITRAGNLCPIGGEEERDGFCHVHDPNGTYQKQQKSKRTAPMKPATFGTKEDRVRVQVAREAIEYLRKNPNCHPEELIDLILGNW
jgi:hypothetical protein